MDSQRGIADKIIAYEDGLLDEKEIVEFFQELVDSGYDKTLQGHYGRAAAFLIERGLVTPRQK